MQNLSPRWESLDKILFNKKKAKSLRKIPFHKSELCINFKSKIWDVKFVNKTKSPERKTLAKAFTKISINKY